MYLRIIQCSIARGWTVRLSCCAIGRVECAPVGELLCFPAEACGIRYRLIHVHVRDVIRNLDGGPFSSDSLATLHRVC